MKSLENNRESRRIRAAQQAKRAQAYLAQLRWLEGFHFRGHWYTLDGDPTEMIVDGLTIERARRALNILRRDHLESLETLVDRPDAWLTAVDALLRQLGRDLTAVATVALDCVPSRVRTSARVLQGEHAGLAPLVWAAVTTWVLKPKQLERVLAWMGERAPSLTALSAAAAPEGLRRLLRLARLGATDDADVDAALELLSAAPPDPVEVARHLHWLIKHLEGRSRRDRDHRRDPKPVDLAQWVDRLLDQPSTVRTRALALLAAVELTGVLAPWCAWQREHGATMDRASVGLVEGSRGRSATWSRAGLAEKLRQARAAMPYRVSLERSLSAILELAEGPEPLYRALVRLMAAPALRTTSHARVHFLGHAGDVALYVENARPVACFWDALAQELAQGAPDALLIAWDPVLQGYSRCWLEEDALESGGRPVEVKRLARAMAVLAATTPVRVEHMQRLAAAIAAGLESDLAAALVARLGPEIGIPSRHLVRSACVLAGPDTESLATQLSALARLDFGEGGPEVFAELCEYAAASGSAWVVRGLMVADAPRLTEIVALMRLVPRGSWPRFEDVSASAPWIAAYPPALEEPLRRLARVTADAEDVARRRLAADLPDRQALALEAANLRARSSLAEPLRRRLHALEARMSASRSLSPVRLQRLATKLDAAAVRCAADRFAAALVEQAQPRILERLGLREWPGEVLDRQGWSFLSALARLGAKRRALAARLLEARGGSPPWDLRDDPVNQRFLQRVRARVDTSAWLDDRPRVVTAGDGAPLELAFASDPVQVFEMGRHFSTCLSPDGGNFFSVVTNAADVNKRVLYGRRNGKVVARCLLALTDTGDVLVFHPYAHDAQLKFDVLVRDFASDLAARMGSRVVPYGRVSLLLGADWYDDGAQDITGRFEALGRAAARLAEVPADRVVDALEEALGHRIDDTTLPYIVALPQVAKRPELIEVLAPYLLRHPTVPDHTLQAAAGMAMAVGDVTLAGQLIAGPASRSAFRYDAWSIGAIAAQAQPALALARLRHTRPRGVRRLDQERGERAAVAALALEKMHRPAQAIEMYRRAMSDEPRMADVLRPRLDALLKSRPARE